MNTTDTAVPTTPAHAQVMAVTVPLLGATEALSALGASLRLRHDATTLAPELADCIDRVLGALGVRDGVDALDVPQTEALLGIVQGFLAQAADFVVRPDRDGWNHRDPSVLMSQGHTSVLIAMALERFVLPSIGSDLRERLEAPGASFLDVGVGVAALSIAMCRQWPSLRVVGVDPWEPALALARQSVAAAGLEDRVELRQTVAETLADEDEFDLAWVPTFFTPRAALDGIAERTLAALRPGGWATFGLYGRPGEPLADAIADMRTARQGGALVEPHEVVALLERTGYSEVGVHFDPSWRLPVVFVAGRRP